MRALSFFFLIAAVLPLDAQIGGTPYPPGGYPGGQYPGQYPGRYPGSGYPGAGGSIPGIPRRGKKAPEKGKVDQQHPLQKINGSLRKVDDKSVTIYTDDNRTLAVKRIEKTNFTNKKGEKSDPANWKPGDYLNIEATQDDQGFYYAVNVIFDREGTSAERTAAAAAPVIEGEGSGDSSEETPPRITRTPGKSTAPATTGAPTEQEQAQAPKEQARTPKEQDQEEQARRSVPPLEDKPMDADDPGRPRIHRGKPDARTTTTTASNTTPATPPRVLGEAAPPPKVPADWKTEPDYSKGEASITRPRPQAQDTAIAEDKLITKARTNTDQWLESLPNYYCQEIIARYISETRPANWQATDVVSAALVYEKGKERYTDLRINNKPVKKGMEQLSGSWSTGEFASVVNDIFSPATDALFRLSRTDTLNGRDATVFSFEVEQQNSHWRVTMASQTFFPAYKGSIWIDKETGRVLRIEMQSRKIPGTFPIDTAELTVEFDYIRIASAKYLLPTHSEVLSCFRGTENCSHNVIDFRNYHKYEGQSVITFSDSNITYDQKK